MASKKENAQSFEERLNALEALVRKMEEGGMALDETLKAYEAGVALAELLKGELDAAQERLTVLKAGAQAPAEGV